MTRAVSCLVLLALAYPLPAQDPPPAKVPAEPKSDSLDARKLYAKGAMQAKQGLYLDAVKSLEACLKLDPEALPPRRMLAIHLATVGRLDEALAMAHEVTERAPDDHEAWRIYAEHLRESGDKAEALHALRRATECAAAAKYPEQFVGLLNRLGTWAREAGDQRTAERAYRKLLDVLEANRKQFATSGFLDPEAWLFEKATAAEYLGEALLKQRRPDDALKAFELARACFADRSDTRAQLWSYRLHWHLAQVHLAARNPAAARDHVQTYLQHVRPASVEPYRLLADAMTALGEGRDAPHVLAEYARKAPDNLQLQMLVAETHSRTGRDDRAEQVYRDIAAKNPSTEVYRALFTLYERTERLDLVRERLDEHFAILDDDASSTEKRKKASEHTQPMIAALLTNPKLIARLLPLADQERDRQFRNRQNNRYGTFDRLVTLAVRTGELDEVERILRESATGFGRRRRFGAQYDDALLEVLVARRKFEDVKAICRDRLLAPGNNLFMYCYYLDQALFHLGEMDEALQTNEQAFDAAPNEYFKVTCRLRRADMLLASDRGEEAVRLCRNLLEEYPQPRHVRMTRFKFSSVLLHLRRFDEAEKVLRELLEQDPNDASACNSLGYVLADEGRNFDEAERLIRRALVLDREGRGAGEPESAMYLDSLAWVLFRKGKVAEARKIMEQAVAQPDGREEGTLWDHLGDIRYKMGESRSAREAWQRAADLYRYEPLSKKDGRADELERKLKMLH